LHAEKEAVKNTVPPVLPAILSGWKLYRAAKRVLARVKTGDKPGELRPAQTEQPAIDIAPPPRVRPDFDELDLAGAEGKQESVFLFMFL
jgi:hypothetical protein